MGSIEVRFLGTGDAFGSGGRFQPCILVKTDETKFLVDCGTSSLISMRRYSVDPSTIDTILITHLHADHFGGIPFFLLDAQFVSKRLNPVMIAGPRGAKRRIENLMEAMFPNSSTTQFTYAIDVIEMEPESPQELRGITVVPYLVEHPSGNPPLSLRINCGGKTITYTGDTEWTDSLIKAARDSDLLIAEAYFFERKIRFHLDFQTLKAHMNQLRTKKVILMHMSPDMLSRADQLEYECAEDGKLLIL